MKITKPNRITRTFTQKLVKEPSKVFPLLCPVREADWIEDWDPEVVISQSGVAELDCIFVTESNPHKAIWYVTKHEPSNGVVEIIKITPEVTACKLSIELRPVEGGSEANVTYSHTSLGSEGDAFLASFTDDNFSQFMRTWEAQLNHYLAHGTLLRAD